MARDHRGHHVPLTRRHVNQPTNPAFLADPHDLAMIGFYGVQVIVDGDHAVPGSVVLEVIRLRVRDRVGPLIGTEVVDHRPTSVAVNANDAVGNTRHTVRAAGAGQDRVQVPVDEGYI